MKSHCMKFETVPNGSDTNAELERMQSTIGGEAEGATFQ